MLESILNKVAELKKSATLLKRDSTQSFPVRFAKFLRTPFSAEYNTFLIRYFEDILTLFLQMNNFLRTGNETEMVSKVGYCFKGQNMPPVLHIKPKIFQT